jgi:peptide/nickel transport system permease protein
LILFGVLSLKPGDPIEDMRLGNPGFTQADYDRLRELYGLDRPWYVQYVRWLGRVVRGDFGPSRQFGRPAGDLVFHSALPNTLLLSSISLVVALLISIPAGVLAAAHQHRALDHSVAIASYVGYSIPSFWLGILLIYVFAVRLHLLPSQGIAGLGMQGWWDILVDRLRHLLLPATVLVMFQCARWTRFIRSAMLDTIYLDYVTTARAKGLSERIVLWRHGLRNSILPVITLLGLYIPQLLSGVLLVEIVFNRPGMGRTIYDAMLHKDLNVAMVALLFVSLLVVVCNLIADVVYVIADPRIRYE